MATPVFRHRYLPGLLATRKRGLYPGHGDSQDVRMRRMRRMGRMGGWEDGRKLRIGGWGNDKDGEDEIGTGDKP
jgi:hypothetical protein